MSLSDEQVRQLEHVLSERFFRLIDEHYKNVDEFERKKPRDKYQASLSYSLASLALCKLAVLPPSSAVACLIDGFNDNGIDALYYDHFASALYLIQSKFKRSGEPNKSDAEAFASGIKDLIERKYDRFNHLFSNHLNAIEEALDQPHLKIIGVLTHIGGHLQKHAQYVIDDLGKDVNRFGSRLEIVNFNGEAVLTSLTEEHAQAQVDASITVENWFFSQANPRILYGQISVSQLAELHKQYGKRLFEKNIRYYMGSTTVNEAIAETLQQEPNKLFYLNNGLTAICQALNAKPTAKQERGTFEIAQLSVVNGAQTIGSIARVSRDIDLSTSPAKVLITLIELKDAEPNFGSEVTKARNLQNQVSLLDFASQDPKQERLRRELAMLGIKYSYKPENDAAIKASTSLNLEEASLALACLNRSPDLAIQSKLGASQLRDPEAASYRAIFTEKLEAISVYRAVQIYKFLDSIIAENEKQASRPFDRLCYRHLRHLMMFMVRNYHPILQSVEKDFSREQKTLARIAELLNQNKVFDGIELYVSEGDKQTLSRQFDEVTRYLIEESERLIREKGDNSGVRALSRNAVNNRELIRRSEIKLREWMKKQISSRIELRQNL